MSYDYDAPNLAPRAAPPRPLVGSPKQIEWATRIYGDLAERFGAAALPDIAEARFWIDARGCATAVHLREVTRAFLAERDANFTSPFTDRFPRYSTDEARTALEGLRGLAGTIGVVVLDLETTGLERSDRVVEIAAVRWPSLDLDPIPLVDTLVRPPDLMAAAEVTGIGADELAEARPFEAVAAEVAEWAGRCHLISWNSRFDMPVLRREIAHAGLPAPLVRATCAMRLAAGLLELDGWPSLEEVAGRLHINRAEPAHRAMSDVMTTCAILRAIRGEAAGG